jgi:hypothetical protein
MFFMWGWKSKIIASKAVNSECPHCHSHDRRAIILQKYIWIGAPLLPLFPLRKTTLLECNACSRVAQFDIKADHDLHPFILQSRAPIWMFSGLAMFALIFGFAMISSYRHDQAIAEFKMAPSIGTIFVMRVPTADEQNMFAVFQIIEKRPDGKFYTIRHSKMMWSNAITAREAANDRAPSSEGTDGFFEESTSVIPAEKFVDSPIVYVSDESISNVSPHRTSSSPSGAI